MDNLLKKIESSRGEEVLSLIKEYMEAYCLQLKKSSGVYGLYSTELEERVFIVEDEEDLIKIISEYLEVASNQYPSNTFSEEALVKLNCDYYKLTGKHLDKLRNLNVLELLKVVSKKGIEGANLELLRKARQNGISISKGYCVYNDYEGIDMDENLIKVLDIYNIKYPARLIELTKEPMADCIEEEKIVLELDKVKYEVVSWIGNLKCDGCYTTSNWVDFNTIKRI